MHPQSLLVWNDYEQKITMIGLTWNQLQTNQPNFDKRASNTFQDDTVKEVDPKDPLKQYHLH